MKSQSFEECGSDLNLVSINTIQKSFSLRVLWNRVFYDVQNHGEPACKARKSSLNLLRRQEILHKFHEISQPSRPPTFQGGST